MKIEKITNNTQLFSISDIKGELLVTYTKKITKHPERIEEGHGFHKFNDNEVEISIESVELIIDDKGIDITRLLSDKQNRHIETIVGLYD